MVCTKKLIGLAVVMVGGKLKQTIGLHHEGTVGLHLSAAQKYR